jgi:TRAP-type C4-dicarboxylate transport system permease small subunit
VQFGWSQNSELAELPMTFIFIAWPLTGLTWLLFGLERMRADLRIVIDGPGPDDTPKHRDIGTGSVV